MGTGKLTDLDFANDIALISDSPVALQNMTTDLQGNAAKVGLRIIAEKTKAMAGGNTLALSLRVEHKDMEFVEQSSTLPATYQETVMPTMTYTHGQGKLRCTDVFAQCGGKKSLTRCLYCVECPQYSTRRRSASNMHRSSMLRKTGRYGKPSNVIISLLRKKIQL